MPPARLPSVSVSGRRWSDSASDWTVSYSSAAEQRAHLVEDGLLDAVPARERAHERLAVGARVDAAPAAAAAGAAPLASGSRAASTARRTTFGRSRRTRR